MQIAGSATRKTNKIYLFFVEVPRQGGEEGDRHYKCRNCTKIVHVTKKMNCNLSSKYTARCQG